MREITDGQMRLMSSRGASRVWGLVRIALPSLQSSLLGAALPIATLVCGRTGGILGTIERQEETPIFPLIITRVVATTSDVDEFVARYFRNFTDDIVFVPTEGIQPPGRRVRFVFALADGRDLVTGEGVVLRMRRDSGDLARPAGMDLRYQVLDEDSQRMIDRLLSRRRAPSPPPPYVSMSFASGNTASSLLPARMLVPLPPPAPPAVPSLASLPSLAAGARGPTLPANPLADVTTPALAAFVEHALVDQTCRFPRWRPPTDSARFCAGLATGAAILAIVGLITVVRRHTAAHPLAAEGRPSTADTAEAATAPPTVTAVDRRPSAAPGVGGNGAVIGHDVDSLGATPSVATGPRPAATGGVRPLRRSVTLSITTLPPGSTIFVDGEARGPSPLVLAVAPGAHDVVAERARYATAHAHVDGPGHVELSHERPPATLRVTSVPSGAQLWLDGRHVGSTPIEVSCAGYELHRLQLEILRPHRAPPRLRAPAHGQRQRRAAGGAPTLVDQPRAIGVAHHFR